MSEMRVSKFNNHSRWYNILMSSALSITAFIALIALLALLFPLLVMPHREQEQQSMVNAQATNAAAKPPRTLKSYSSLDLNGLPPNLTDVIAANLLTYTEIETVKHTSLVPSEPSFSAITDVWCITIYPEAKLKLYAAPYGRGSEQALTQSGEPVGRITALERNNRWELYRPEAYDWSDLGC